MSAAGRESGNGAGAEKQRRPWAVYRHFTSAKAAEPQSREYALRMPNLRELLDAQFEHRQYLLAPWLREQESAMVYAASGVGKSLFALSAALAVAGGGKFMDWQPETKADGQGWRVLYVDGEMHIGDIQERARQLRGAIPELNPAKADQNLVFLARQHQDGGARFPSITEDAGQQFILEQIKTSKFDLVVLDNFSTLGAVEDENAASSFNAIQAFLLHMKVHKVATILVHHTGKAEDNFRGSSKLAATFETIIQLERPGTYWRGGSRFSAMPRRGPNGAPVRAPEGMTENGVARFRVRWDKVRAGSRELRAVAAALVSNGIGEDDAGRCAFQCLSPLK